MKKTLLTAALLCTAASFAQNNSTIVTGTVADSKNNVSVGTGAGISNTGTENTFVGTIAGNNNTFGTNNVFIGMRAGYSNTNAVNNTFIGMQAGYGNTTTSDNVFVGTSSGYYNNGIRNTFVGSLSGRGNTIGEDNVFMGFSSGSRNTEGKLNTFIGKDSGMNNILSRSNTYVGAATGKYREGDFNTFIGNSAGAGLVNVTDAEYINSFNNVYVGSQSGYNSKGNSNAFFGTDAGYNNVGTANTLVGHGAGYNMGTNILKAENNIAVGVRSGDYIGGNNNVCIGNEAGAGNSGSRLGSYNILIGYKAGRLETGSHKLYITDSETNPPLVYGEMDNKILKFNATKVGIGDSFGTFPTPTSPDLSSYRLFVKGGILASEVRVRTDLWPDYVFNGDYKMLSLAETEQFIKKNRHLPNMPSARQIEEEGLELGNIVKLQQEKIEELTLRLIEQDKEMKAIKEKLSAILNK